MKIYTKTGDDGTTGLLYGGRVHKNDIRTAAYGDVDEANAAIGLARSLGPQAQGLAGLLLKVQRELFVLGAELATSVENSAKLKPLVSKVTEEMITAMEESIDRLTTVAPLPQNFIVPGSLSVSAALDLARAVVRRAERSAIALNQAQGLADDVALRYLNRLSDFLFVAARYEESARGVVASPSRED